MELFSIIIGFILGGLVFTPLTLHLCSKSQKKTFEKVGNWIYNFAPKFITKVEGEDYYKFSTNFLIKYQEYINDL